MKRILLSFRSSFRFFHFRLFFFSNLSILPFRWKLFSLFDTQVDVFEALKRILKIHGQKKDLNGTSVYIWVWKLFQCVRRISLKILSTFSLLVLSKIAELCISGWCWRICLKERSYVFEKKFETFSSSSQIKALFHFRYIIRSFLSFTLFSSLSFHSSVFSWYVLLGRFFDSILQYENNRS